MATRSKDETNETDKTAILTRISGLFRGGNRPAPVTGTKFRLCAYDRATRVDAACP